MTNELPRGPRPATPEPSARVARSDPPHEHGDAGPHDDAGQPSQSTELSWRVPNGMIAIKIVGLVGFILGAVLLARDPAGVAITAAAVLVVGAYLLRDLLAPVRLAADPSGVTAVTGFAGRRHIPWRDVERIRIDERRRLGARSALLEIDTGSSIYLFGTSDLGASPEEVADALRRFRTGR